MGYLGRCLGALALIAGALSSLPAYAVDFSGKTIEWIVPFGPGGGTDVWARFYAPYLSARLPGKPTIVVKNVPGGGSVIGTNQFQERAKPDGLTALATSSSTQYVYLLGDKRVKFDYSKWIPVVGSPTGGVIYASSDLGIKGASEIAQLKGKTLKYAGQRPNSTDIVSLLAFRLLDLNVAAGFGMAGRGEARLAFERGETNIDYQSTPGYLGNVVPLVKAGKAVPLFSYGTFDDKGKLVRDPTFPELPTFLEAYQMAYGKPPTPGIELSAWMAFFAAGYGMENIMFLPEGTPADIVAAYRKAAEEVVADPKFIADSQAQLGVYKQFVGASAERMLGVVLGLNDAEKNWIKDWLRKDFGAEL